MAHPLFGWLLTPDSQVQVRFRAEVVQHIDPDGNRRTVHPDSDLNSGKAPQLVCYGCSFTYGTGLADEETFCSLLQRQLPDWQVQNKGVGGHGTIQSLLRFQQDASAGKVNTAVFGVLSDHRYRNFPHPQRMTSHQSLDWHRIGVERVPHGHLTRQGELEVRYTPTWQPGLERTDFEAFLPDEFMLDVITLEAFREIRMIADQHSIPVVFALLDRLDPDFNRKMSKQFSETIDVSVLLDEAHTFLPADFHPNARANRAYASGLIEALRKLPGPYGLGRPS